MVKDDLRELFGETADHFEHDILALEIADDHVHLFVQTDPKHSPADISRQFKSYSGKHLLEEYPEIRESYFWGGGFWKVGYYVGCDGSGIRGGGETVYRKDGTLGRMSGFTPDPGGSGNSSSKVVRSVQQSFRR